MSIQAKASRRPLTASFLRMSQHTYSHRQWRLNLVGSCLKAILRGARPAMLFEATQKASDFVGTSCDHFDANADQALNLSLANRQMAEDSISRLHGTIPVGFSLPIQVRFADTDAQRRLKTCTTLPAAHVPIRPTAVPNLSSYVFGSSPSDRGSLASSLEHSLASGFAFDTRGHSPLSMMNMNSNSSYTSKFGSPLPEAVLSGLVDKFKTSASAPEWWLGSSPVSFAPFSASAPPGCFTVPEDCEITVAPAQTTYAKHACPIPRTMRVQSIGTLLAASAPSSLSPCQACPTPAEGTEASWITKRKSLPW